MTGGEKRDGPPGRDTGGATASPTMGTLLAMPLFYDFTRLLPYNMGGFGRERKERKLVAIFRELSFHEQLLV